MKEIKSGDILFADSIDIFLNHKNMFDVIYDILVNICNIDGIITEHYDDST